MKMWQRKIVNTWNFLTDNLLSTEIFTYVPEATGMMNYFPNLKSTWLLRSRWQESASVETISGNPVTFIFKIVIVYGVAAAFLDFKQD